MRRPLAAAVLIGVLTFVLLAAAALDGNRAAAMPSFGTDCASCHGVPNPTAPPGEESNQAAATGIDCVGCHSESNPSTPPGEASATKVSQLNVYYGLGYNDYTPGHLTCAPVGNTLQINGYGFPANSTFYVTIEEIDPSTHNQQNYQVTTNPTGDFVLDIFIDGVVYYVGHVYQVTTPYEGPPTYTPEQMLSAVFEVVEKPAQTAAPA